jgi:hypothetical protein
MGFKKSTKVENKRDVYPGGSSKLGRYRIPNEAEDPKQFNDYKEKFESTKSSKCSEKSYARSNQKVYSRGLQEKNVRKLLFIHEGLTGFEELPLRSKMSEIINQSSDELQDLFYDLGIKGELPKSWDNFKNFVVEYCTGESISAFQKFKEESWSRYFKRLCEWCDIRKISNEKMFKKVRSENLPYELKVIFYSLDVNVEEAMNRIIEYEGYYKTPRHEIQKGTKENYKDENFDKMQKKGVTLVEV